MKIYRPSYIMLCGDTSLDQCLCDKCKNCKQILKALLSIGMKNILANRYAAIEKVVCNDRYPQVRTQFSFPKLDCLLGSCQMCGKTQLEEMIRNNNSEMFSANRQFTWHRWMTRVGKSALEKCQI